MKEWFVMAYLTLHGGHKLYDGGTMYSQKQTTRLVGGEDMEIQLKEDDVILPGLIDIHVHLAISASSIGCAPMTFLQSGVIAVGDAGTYGWANWPVEDRNEGMASRYWISLISDGLEQHPHVPIFRADLSNMEESLAQLFHHHKSSLIGLKIRLGQHDDHEDRLLLRQGVEYARQLNVPLMIHPTRSFLSIEEVIEPLKEDDVLTHLFQGQRGSIISRGQVVPKIFDAIERGVRLDVAHGANHFSWDVFNVAFAEGIIPHTISTDITRTTWNNSPVYNLAYVISKLLAAGMSWTDVYRGVYGNPRNYFEAMLPSDCVVVLQPEYRREIFLDAMGRGIIGDCVWNVRLVVVDGRMIVNQVS